LHEIIRNPSAQHFAGAVEKARDQLRRPLWHRRNYISLQLQRSFLHLPDR
jgi:hypothetical protein